MPTIPHATPGNTFHVMGHGSPFTVLTRCVRHARKTAVGMNPGTWRTNTASENDKSRGTYSTGSHQHGQLNGLQSLNCGPWPTSKGKAQKASLSPPSGLPIFIIRSELTAWCAKTDAEQKHGSKDATPTINVPPIAPLPEPIPDPAEGSRVRQSQCCKYPISNKS